MLKWVLIGVNTGMILGLLFLRYDADTKIKSLQEELDVVTANVELHDLADQNRITEIANIKTQLDKQTEEISIIEESIDPKNFRWAKIKKVRDAVQDTIEENGYTKVPNIIGLTKYASAVVDYSEKYDVSIPLILAVTKRESAFRPEVTSHAGARGLMQVMPATAKEISVDVGNRYYNLYKIQDNVHFGTWYLWKMLDQFNGDVGLAVRGYNCGPTCVRKVLAEEWSDYPAETRKYVEIVLEWKKNYEELGL